MIWRGIVHGLNTVRQRHIKLYGSELEGQLSIVTLLNQFICERLGAANGQVFHAIEITVDIL